MTNMNNLYISHSFRVIFASICAVLHSSLPYCQIATLPLWEVVADRMYLLYPFRISSIPVSYLLYICSVSVIYLLRVCFILALCLLYTRSVSAPYLLRVCSMFSLSL